MHCVFQRKANQIYLRNRAQGLAKHVSLGRDIKDKFISLGPTYIKLGQMLSTRPDLVSKEYVDAFSSLQDQVPAFPGTEAVETIERELGGRIGDIFSQFNSTPIASASIGQVHLAELNGRTVAVKVQRPGVKQLFDMDLGVLSILVTLLDSFYSNIDGVRFDWKALFEEYTDIMYQELDYRREGLQGIRFRRDFAGIPWVAIPQVLMNTSTSRVLTMEYLPGMKITDVKAIEEAGFSRKLLANRLAESYLIQICKHGFFHCDPHPGNLAVDRGHPDGRIIYYDFGMMSELNQSIRSSFAELVLAMYDNNVQGAYDAFYQLGVIDKEADQNDIKKVLTVFLEEFNSLVFTNTGIYTSQLSAEEQDLLVRKRRLKLGAELWVKLESEGLFKLPSTYTFIARAFNCLDGVGKSLNPRYDLFKVAQPFVSDLVQAEAGVTNVEIQFWRSAAGRFLRSMGVIGRRKIKKSPDEGISERKEKLSSQRDQEVIKDMVIDNRVQLRKLLMQQSNLINLGKMSALALLFKVVNNSRAILQPKSTLSTAAKIWTSLQGTAIAAGSVRFLVGVVKGSVSPQVR